MDRRIQSITSRRSLNSEGQFFALQETRDRLQHVLERRRQAAVSEASNATSPPTTTPVTEASTGTSTPTTTPHSMARGNLNKSKETTPTATTALKVVPRGPFSTRIEIPPFGPHFIKFQKYFF